MLDGRRRGRIGSEDVRSCLPCVKAADAERRRAAVGREGRRRGRIGREDVELSHGRAAMAIVREVFRRGRIGRDDVLLKNCGDVIFLQLAPGLALFITCARIACAGCCASLLCMRGLASLLCGCTTSPFFILLVKVRGRGKYRKRGFILVKNPSKGGVFVRIRN